MDKHRKVNRNIWVSDRGRLVYILVKYLCVLPQVSLGITEQSSITEPGRARKSNSGEGKAEGNIRRPFLSTNDSGGLKPTYDDAGNATLYAAMSLTALPKRNFGLGFIMQIGFLAGVCARRSEVVRRGEREGATYFDLDPGHMLMEKGGIERKGGGTRQDEWWVSAGCRENNLFEVREKLRLILLAESNAASVPGATGMAASAIRKP